MIEQVIRLADGDDPLAVNDQRGGSGLRFVLRVDEGVVEDDHDQTLIKIAKEQQEFCHPFVQVACPWSLPERV